MITATQAKGIYKRMVLEGEPTKYILGDIVYIGDMPKYMDHFAKNCVGIISEVDRKDRGSTYMIQIWDDNQWNICGWYEDEQLELIEDKEIIKWIKKAAKYA